MPLIPHTRQISLLALSTKKDLKANRFLADRLKEKRKAGLLARTRSEAEEPE